MKTCLLCKNKPIRNGVYKDHLENFVENNLPKDNKIYYNKNGNKIILSNLILNKTIFYFATNEYDFTKKIKTQVEAYNKLENSGISRINKDGKTVIYLKCPQLYINIDGNVHSRHIHFIYWDDKKKEWNKNLYTQQIICNVQEDFVIKYMKESIIIDARIPEYYIKSHVKNSINLPYNKRWTEKNVIEEFKKENKDYNENKLIPIIIYCSKGSNSGEILYHKLNKLGFFNIIHAEGNLLSLR